MVVSRRTSAAVRSWFDGMSDRPGVDSSAMMTEAASASPNNTSPVPRVDLRFLDAATHGGVALRIDVDEQHAAARRGERGREIHGGGRLADAALLVRDRDDALHGGILLRESRHPCLYLSGRF